MNLYYYIGFLAVMSALAFVLYFADKRKAQCGAWRIKESLLLSVGFLGGAVGALLAMKLFRHKTKHSYFWIVNFAGLVLHILLLIFFVLRETGAL